MPDHAPNVTAQQLKDAMPMFLSTAHKQVALPPDADSFCAMIGFAGIVILTVSYAGLVLLPNVAIHTTASAASSSSNPK